MPTDIAALKADIQAERDSVVEVLSNIDIPAEETRLANAETTFRAAENTYNKAQERYSILKDKQDRLNVLDRQLALFP